MSMVITDIGAHEFQIEVFDALCYGVCDSGEHKVYKDFTTNKIAINFENSEDAVAFTLKGLEQVYKNIMKRNVADAETAPKRVQTMNKTKASQLRDILQRNYQKDYDVYKQSFIEQTKEDSPEKISDDTEILKALRKHKTR